MPSLLIPYPVRFGAVGAIGKDSGMTTIHYPVAVRAIASALVFGEPPLVKAPDMLGKARKIADSAIRALVEVGLDVTGLPGEETGAHEAEAEPALSNGDGTGVFVG
jgi:hypothetical protein